ncbi:unnamed protein product, partial [Closterium sp. NIES-54]
KSSGGGGSTPYDAASTHLMPPTPPQLLPSTHAPTPLMPSTQVTPQLPAGGAASSSLHIEAATNEDEMEGYTTSNWQSPGLMLTAPQYSMEDDYSEDDNSETAEAATKGVMGSGGKWGWRRRVRGEINGSAYNEDEGDDVGLGESIAKVLSAYIKDGSTYNEDKLLDNGDETVYNDNEDDNEVHEEEEVEKEEGEEEEEYGGNGIEAVRRVEEMATRGRVAVEEEEEEEEEEDELEEEEYGGKEIEAVRRVEEMATRGRVAAGFFYSRDGGTFKSPIGVMLSQVKQSGMLEANRVVNSRFSGFGECGPTLKSSALVLAVNKAGGFWNPAMSVKGLQFTSATRRLYAVPNAPNRPVPRGGSNARFYALHDADGSFLSSSSPAFPSAARPAYLVAPFHPILPPASVRTSLCQYHDTWSLYSCRSVCYRAIALTYLEYGVPSLSRNQIKKRRIRPYSTAKFTRLTDRAYFYSLGDRNDYSKLYKGPQPVLRTISATLLAGHAYSVEITPPSVNRGFYPANMTVRVLDKGGCAGGLELRIVPRTRATQWRTITNVPQLPCLGKGGRNPNRMYQRCTYRNKQPTLALSFGRAYALYSGVSIVLGRMKSRTCPPVK